MQMRNYNLNIAGYNIRFETSADGPDLVPSARFLRNISTDNQIRYPDKDPFRVI